MFWPVTEMVHLQGEGASFKVVGHTSQTFVHCLCREAWILWNKIEGSLWRGTNRQWELSQELSNKFLSYTYPVVWWFSGFIIIWRTAGQWDYHVLHVADHFASHYSLSYVLLSYVLRVSGTLNMLSCVSACVWVCHWCLLVIWATVFADWWMFCL